MSRVKPKYRYNWKKNEWEYVINIPDLLYQWRFAEAETLIVQRDFDLCRLIYD